MDKEIFDLIDKENKRQNDGIELIASENYVSKDVRKACGSILTNKYAEGYPDKRYYGGCEYIDEIEKIAISRVCSLFDARYANVQPHSGSQANAAAYRALESIIFKDQEKHRKMRILSLALNDGGHLTHGSPVSFSSNTYDFFFFKLGSSGKIDFNLVEDAIKENKPDVILCGCSAYPYIIDFSKFGELAEKYKCYLMADIAHIAGLVATGNHPNPFPYCDIVTSTTHKTLRGPRGGIILTNDEELSKKVNSAVFPFYQGGPLEHIIAAKAICFAEVKTVDFAKYIEDLIHNTFICCNKLQILGAITSETQNHLFLLNTLESFGLTGLDAQKKLEEIGITTNKNMIPGDTLKPNKTSGLRIGFAAATTRGCTSQDAELIAEIIYSYLKNMISTSDAKKLVSKIVKKWKPIEDI